MSNEESDSTMTLRGRQIAQLFDGVDEDFPKDYLETSGHLDPAVAVRLHDLCVSLYDGRRSVVAAYTFWVDWYGVLECFAEGYGLGSLVELLSLATNLCEVAGPVNSLAPLDREALSSAKDWLEAYIVYYSNADVEDGFQDDSVEFAQYWVDAGLERISGDFRDSEERMTDEESVRATEEYVDELLREYRTVDVV
jgi:hypothetical protein